MAAQTDHEKLNLQLFKVDLLESPNVLLLAFYEQMLE